MDPSPWKSQSHSLVFYRNTGSDPWETTKVPSQHSVRAIIGMRAKRYWLAFLLWTNGGPLCLLCVVFRGNTSTDPLSPLKILLKTLSKLLTWRGLQVKSFDNIFTPPPPPLTKLNGSTHAIWTFQYLTKVTTYDIRYVQKTFDTPLQPYAKFG